MTNRCPKCQTLFANGVICPKCGVNIMDLKEETELVTSVKSGENIPASTNNIQNNTQGYDNPSINNVSQNAVPQQTHIPTQNYYTKKRVFPNLRIIVIIVAIVCFVGGIINYSMAMNVKNNYHNSEFSSKNAYVGGDAYNYIINSNYFTGYTVASVGLFICGALSLVSLIFISVKEKEFECIGFQNSKLANIEHLLNENQNFPLTQMKR